MSAQGAVDAKVGIVGATFSDRLVWTIALLRDVTLAAHAIALNRARQTWAQAVDLDVHRRDDRRLLVPSRVNRDYLVRVVSRFTQGG